MHSALYNKYRPRVFSDVIGQPHIVGTLINQIKSGRTTHAYLFTGSRGTGKTTCAKILAKALNCLSPKDGSPCLNCTGCMSVENGSADVLEIDAASNSSVDSIRDLIERVAYAPADCTKRVYIIDEVHGLSSAASNALLKTIEEPPPHAVFIFATTESHKVLETIVSRCQRFEFRRIPAEATALRLAEISVKENFVLDMAAALLIARLSDGAMRTALSLLESCSNRLEASYSEEKTVITENSVREICGVPDISGLKELVSAAKNSNPSSALSVVYRFSQSGKSMNLVLSELLIFLRDLMLAKTADREIFSSMCSRSDGDISEILEFSAVLELENIFSYLNTVQEFYEKTKSQLDLRIVAEMCAVKMSLPLYPVQNKPLSDGTTVPDFKTDIVMPVPSFQPGIQRTRYTADDKRSFQDMTENLKTSQEHKFVPNQEHTLSDGLWNDIISRLKIVKPLWAANLIDVKNSFDGNILTVFPHNQIKNNFAENAKDTVRRLASEILNREIKVDILFGRTDISLSSEICGKSRTLPENPNILQDCNSKLQGFFEHLRKNGIQAIIK